MKIIKASDAENKSTINMLIYGMPGIGKTTFASTSNKPLIINLEGGEKSISNKDVDLAMCKDCAGVKFAVDYAIKNSYETIVFDSLTRYSEILLDEIVLQDRRKIPQLQHWGEMISRVKKTCWYLQSKNINIIFICNESEIIVEDMIVKRPALNGKLQQSISGIVDVVGYLMINTKGERVVSVNPTHRWYAKHRAPIDMAVKEDLRPDFNFIKKRITGE